MTHETGEPAVAAESTSAPVRWRTRWWFSVIIFGAGMVVGVVLVGLLNVSTPAFTPETTAADTFPRPQASLEVAAQARVNAACLRVINEAQDVHRALDGVGEAATDVDLQRLDDIVRQLQPVEPRLREDLANCSVDTSVTDPVPPAPGTPAPGSPAPSPTSSPTR